MPTATGEPPPKSSPSNASRQFLWPREHGAWGMVLLPFLSAWVLARSGGWPVIAALAAVLATFLIREPVLVLLRQRYRWSQPRAETSAAHRTLTLLAPVLALSGVILALSIPIHSLMALGGLAAILMTLYLWGAMTNRQRSPWLQAAGAVRAMEMDINTDWVSAFTYQPNTTVAGNPIEGVKLLDGMTHDGSQYLEPNVSSRDFFAFTADAKPVAGTTPTTTTTKPKK